MKRILADSGLSLVSATNVAGQTGRISTPKKVMNLIFRFLLLALAALPLSSKAQVAAVESFSGTVPFDAVWPNEFDPFHPKLILLDMVAVNTDGPTTIDVVFDWFDLGGGLEFSPPITVDLLPGVNDIDLAYTIPFCPDQVSLHIESPATWPIVLSGTFTHICQTPETLPTLPVLFLAAVALCALGRPKSLPSSGRR